MINRINPSFGTFKMRAQGCNPDQKEFFDAFKTIFGEKKGISVIKNEPSGDLFVKFKPIEDSTRSRYDALITENSLASSITEETGIQIQPDIYEEEEQLLSDLSNPEKIKEEGEKNLETKGAQYIVDRLEIDAEQYSEFFEAEHNQFEPLSAGKDADVINLLKPKDK